MDNQPTHQPPSVKQERKEAARAAREARAARAAQDQLAALSLGTAASGSAASCRRTLCFEIEH